MWYKKVLKKTLFVVKKKWVLVGDYCPSLIVFKIIAVDQKEKKGLLQLPPLWHKHLPHHIITDMGSWDLIFPIRLSYL